MNDPDRREEIVLEPSAEPETRVEPGAPEVVPTGGATLCELGSSVTEPETSSLDVGDYLHGYQILGRLGEGGMGVVYRALHMELGRDVALKLLTGGRVAGTEALERFRREASVIARLKHPNVIGIYEIGEIGGAPFFAMNLVGGGSLRRAMTAGQVGIERGVRVVSAIARALAHAHEHGIVHRDVKPENVLLETDGTPVLTDFGLARDEDDDGQLRTRTGTIMGTPAYMSPEQAAGRSNECGPATDIYALGAVLYEIAAGTPPFGREAAVVLRRIAVDEPVRPRVVDRSVPRDLETIVLKCLEKDPARRYASAMALAEDLDRVLAGEPILARRLGILERTARKLRRHKAIATTAAAGILAVLSVAGALGRRAWLEARARDRAEAESRRLLEERSRATEVELARLVRRSSAMGPFDRGRTIADALGSIDATLRAEARGEALAQLGRAIELDPEFAEAYHVRGRVHEAAGEIDRALADWAEAFRLEPGHLAARYRWGLAQVIQKVDHAAGRSAFEALRAADPESAYADLGAAFLAIFEKRWADAEEATRAAAAKSPYLPEAHFERGYVAQQRSTLASGSERARLLETSEEAYSRALALRPGDAWTHGNRGIVRELLGRADAALADYDAAIGLDPKFSSAWLNRGLLRFARKDTAGAIADLTASLELKPDSVRGRTNRAVVYLSTGRLDEAAADLAEARRQDPSDGLTVYHLARLARARGDTPGAVTLLGEALRLAGPRVDLLEAVAGMLSALVGPAELLAALDASGAAAGLPPGVRLVRARALDSLGRTAEALEVVDSVVTDAPTPHHLQTRAGWREKIGRVAEARDDYRAIARACAEAEPATRRTAWAVLAQFSMRHDEYLEEGLEAARKAVEADPAWSTAHFLEGRALWLLERQAEALASFDRSVELAPGDADAHENRAGVLRQMGRTEEALAAFERVLELDPSPGRKARIEPIVESLRR